MVPNFECIAEGIAIPGQQATTAFKAGYCYDLACQEKLIMAITKHLSVRVLTDMHNFNSLDAALTKCESAGTSYVIIIELAA